jgi:hypothetical protein
MDQVCNFKDTEDTASCKIYSPSSGERASPHKLGYTAVLALGKGDIVHPVPVRSNPTHDGSVGSRRSGRHFIRELARVQDEVRIETELLSPPNKILVRPSEVGVGLMDRE